jgi:hypothetical protein
MKEQPKSGTIWSNPFSSSEPVAPTEHAGVRKNGINITSVDWTLCWSRRSARLGIVSTDQAP